MGNGGGKCTAGHEPDSRSYEPDELRRGWKECCCPMSACGTLAGSFKRENTERFKWDEAKNVAAAWEAAGVGRQGQIAALGRRRNTPLPPAKEERLMTSGPLHARQPGAAKGSKQARNAPAFVHLLARILFTI